MEIVPDSTEYAFGAQHLANGDGYHVQCGGQNLPPRYPPWFSIALAPAYWVFGPDPGNGIWVVFGFALVGLIVAFELGKRISGTWGGVWAGVLLLAVTDYHYWGRQIMTDVPCTVLIMLLLWIWLLLQESAQGSRWAVAGILLASATAFRPTSFAFVLPFFLSWIRKNPRPWTHLVCLLTPCAILFLFTATYNYKVYGDIARTGYSFWCAVPYDYPKLIYSLQYVSDNFLALINSHWIWLAASLCVLWIVFRRGVAHFLPNFILFSVAGGFPVLLFHMVYFYPDARFFLPLASLMAVGCGGLAGKFFSKWPVWPVILGQIGLIVAGIWMVNSVRNTSVLQRRSIAESILRDIPVDAAIVSAVEPVYLENFPNMGTRQIIPVSRKVEYASKVIVRHKIPEPLPAPEGWWDSRCAGLLAGGAEEAVPWTAFENPERLAKLVASGKSVFLDRVSIPDPLVEKIIQMSNSSHVQPIEGSFVRLTPKIDVADSTME